MAWVVKLFHIVLTEGQTRNSNTLLYDQIIETLFSCHDDFPLHSEILWTFQMFQTYVSSSRYTHIAQIICEGEKIMIPATSLNIHRATYICMYDFQQICCSLHSSGERRFSHLAHEARFASIKWFIIKWFKIPSVWSFFMRFTPIWPKWQCHK